MEVLVWERNWNNVLQEMQWQIKGHYVLKAETEKAWLIKGLFLEKWIIKEWHRIEPIYELTPKDNG